MHYGMEVIRIIDCGIIVQIREFTSESVCMLKEYVLHKVLDVLFDTVRGYLGEHDTTLCATKSDIEEAISYHLQWVKNWSGEISFSDLKKAKRTKDVFVELSLYVYPRRTRISAQEKIIDIPLRGILEETTKHVIVLGPLGAGKTTCMKYLCQKLIYDDEFWPDKLFFPIMIRFRELNRAKDEKTGGLLFEEVLSLLGLEVKYSNALKKMEKGKPQEVFEEKRRIKEGLVIKTLDSLRVLLILDGLDELIQYEEREQAISEIRRLCLSLENCRVIVTSRTGAFPYHVENADQYEICHLADEQVRLFVRKWLGDERATEHFLAEIKNSPFVDTTIRPLTLAHLCAIFERVGRIPEKPKTLYRKIVYLLLVEWDQQRSVKRVSRYGNFEVDRKFEFLCELAYELTITQGSPSFSESALSTTYNRIYKNYNIPKNERRLVVNELESHTGLFLQIGYDRYEFAHKSIQEYLAAEYIVKLPNLPNNLDILIQIPNELAVAAAVSSKPSDYVCQVLRKIIDIQPYRKAEGFLSVFFNRLVSEKPEFGTNMMLLVSLLRIYAEHLTNRKSIGAPYSKVPVTSFMIDLEKMISLAASVDSLKSVLFFYETEGILQTEDDDTLCRMAKQYRSSFIERETRDFKAPAKWAELPKEIFVRSSWLPKEIEG